MNFTNHIIGKGSPRVAIVACLHGDELVGVHVLKQLETLRLKQGSISLITAHPAAIAQKKRFITYDLNRNFPGNPKGPDEKGLAHKLLQYLQPFDYVIDVHATSSNIQELIIATQFTPAVLALLKNVPIKRVMLAPRQVFGGNELIAHVAAGISLDYGPHKEAGAEKIVSDINQFLCNIGLIDGQKKIVRNKEVYTIKEAYEVPPLFKTSIRLREFEKISKDDLIGTTKNGITIKAMYTFYPLFLHHGRYEDTLCLAADKKENIICP